MLITSYFLKMNVTSLCLVICLTLGVTLGDEVPPLVKVRSPVILLPGLEASQVEAKITNKEERPHFFCAKNSDWFLIWLNAEEMLPQVIDCFMENFKLTYNRTSRRTENSRNVQIRIPGFGETHSVEFLSNLEIGPLTYFNNLVNKLVEIGYERNVTVRGAPYDFRKSPNENEEYFVDLKDLIEETFKSNGDEKVTLVCHSMGCLYSLYFLNHQSREWKSRFVTKLVTISAPFGGATQAVTALTTGTNFHMFIYKDQKFRTMERTFSSLPFLLPVENIWKDRPLVTWDGINYTAGDLGKLYKLLNDSDGFEMYQDTKDLISGHDHPGVDIVCIHGKNKPTPEILNYPTLQSFPDSPLILYGDGDGTVNDVSAAICETWSQNKNFKFSSATIPDIGHVDMARHDDVVKVVIQEILKN